MYYLPWVRVKNTECDGGVCSGNLDDVCNVQAAGWISGCSQHQSFWFILFSMSQWQPSPHRWRLNGLLNSWVLHHRSPGGSEAAVTALPHTLGHTRKPCMYVLCLHGSVLLAAPQPRWWRRLGSFGMRRRQTALWLRRSTGLISSVESQDGTGRD